MQNLTEEELRQLNDIRRRLLGDEEYRRIYEPSPDDRHALIGTTRAS